MAVEALNDQPLALHWCVDLDRDVYGGNPPPTTDSPIAPGNDLWGQFLTRFRGACDRLPWDRSAVPLAVTVAYTLRVAGTAPQRMLLTFSVPYLVNVARLAHAPPPVGVWRLWHPPRETKLPSTFWMDGIPF